MKIRFILFSILLSFAFYTIIQAQNGFNKSGITDNWFLHLGVGGQIFLGDNDNKADFKDRISVMPAISAGKWINPCWGIQIKGEGGALHGYENQGNYRQKDKYYNAHLDVLWNLTNQMRGYSSSRVMEITPYVGLGFAHRFEMDDSELTPDVSGVQSNYKDCVNAISFNGGVKFGFNLFQRVRLDLDLGASVLPDYFDRIVQGAQYESVLSAVVGLTYKLGKIGFDPVKSINPALMGELNQKINTLRDENEKLSNQLAEIKKQDPNCPFSAPQVSTSTEINYIPNIVFFRLNSFQVDENQQISIYNTADFVKEKGSKIKVVGYADKNTGSHQFNLKISEKRAKAVAHELISKYDVPSNNIIIEWKGAVEQLHQKNDWNRVVIMTPCD